MPSAATAPALTAQKQVADDIIMQLFSPFANLPAADAEAEAVAADAAGVQKAATEVNGQTRLCMAALPAA